MVIGTNITLAHSMVRHRCFRSLNAYSIVSFFFSFSCCCCIVKFANSFIHFIQRIENIDAVFVSCTLLVAMWLIELKASMPYHTNFVRIHRLAWPNNDLFALVQ